jgi:transposase
MTLILTDKERKEITALYRNCSQRRFADRLKAILLLADGFSCIEVGRILLLDDDTVRIYRNQYLNQGAQSLLTDGNKGSSAKLNEFQITKLDEHLKEKTYADTKGIIAWIKEQFKMEYTTSGINSFLKRLGFVYKKPVLTPCKANVEKQLEFIKEYRELKSKLEQDDQIYFMDGVHPQHNTIASYGWIKKVYTKQLKTNNGRKRTNINGAINLAAKEVFYVEDERINSQTMIDLLQVMLDGQQKGKIYVVLDNARYYHSILVKTFLEKHQRIILKFLPPYSPNLNIIERLWHVLKKKVVYNKFYLKFEDFRKEVLSFFKNKVWLGKEFDNLLTDNFQIIKPDFSGSYLV